MNRATNPVPPSSALAQWWVGLAARERMMVLIAAWVLGLGLLWMLGIAPAWRILEAAPQRHQELDAQLSRMQSLGAQARAVQAERSGTLPDRATSIRLIEDVARSMGPAGQVSVSGDQVTLRVDRVTPDQLARGLDQLRRVARSTPTGADLQWQGGGWQGTVTLTGPGLEP